MRDGIAKPIPEIFEAAVLLKYAVKAHLNNDEALAKKLIIAADISILGDWLDPIWLHRSLLVRPKKVPGLPPIVPKDLRDQNRMPNIGMKRRLIARDGHHCRFCGIPVIRAEIRKELCKRYPIEARWTSTKETDQHRGLQVLWLQYDHIEVHSRGGKTNLDNLVIACVACNFGRDRFTLEEMEMRDPRNELKLPSWEGRFQWNGLESLFPVKKQMVQDKNSQFFNLI